MDDDNREVRSISWRDLFPWLIIFRTFGVSISLPVLFLATLGTLITPLGWRAGSWMFLDAKQIAADPSFENIVKDNNRWPGQRPVSESRDGPGREFWRDVVFRSRGNPSAVFQTYIDPFVRLFDIELSLTRCAYFLFGGLWTLLVWALAAGAITRIAAMQMGREERIGLREAFSHAAGKLGHYFVAPLGPLVLVAFIAVPAVLLGLLLHIPAGTGHDFGVLVVGAVWVFVLLSGFISAVLLLGLLFGWPLMWGAISSEGTDALDALSRSFTYTFQRPLHYLFYAAVALVLGTLGWLFVSTLAESVIELSYWATAWGAGHEHVEELRRAVESGNANSMLAWVGSGLLAYAVALVRTIAVAFSYSFFWCAATAIYLLLRRDVDQAEFDEIFVEEETQRYGLPPLSVDSAGVPGLAETPSPDPPDEASPDKSPPDKSPPDDQPPPPDEPN